MRQVKKFSNQLKERKKVGLVQKSKEKAKHIRKMRLDLIKTSKYMTIENVEEELKKQKAEIKLIKKKHCRRQREILE